MKKGEEFLNEVFPRLAMSNEVIKTASKSDTPSEKIKKYMDRLSLINEMAYKKGKRYYLYDLYFKKYIYANLLSFSESDMNEYIIRAQVHSLKKWLDYLTNPEIDYPMWAKFWVFQGVLKIGTYVEKEDKYSKRIKTTKSPFIDANPAVIDKCITEIQNRLKNEKLKMSEIVRNSNFQKMYLDFLQEFRANRICSNSIKGEWKCFEPNVKDAYRLYDSLQGTGVQWCTANAIDITITQLCCEDSGNFYVYCTYDNNGNPKIPRLAIRTDINNNIVEIRGVMDNSQNVESGFGDILSDKLDEIGISPLDKKEAFLKIYNSRTLTRLNKTRIRELSKEDQDYIYISDIITFGSEKDERIEKIKKRYKVTYADIMIKLLQLNPSDICYVSRDLLSNIDIIKSVIVTYPWFVKYIVDELKNDKLFIKELLYINPLIYMYIIDSLKDDKELSLIAVSLYSDNYEYVSERLKGDLLVINTANRSHSSISKDEKKLDLKRVSF